MLATRAFTLGSVLTQSVALSEFIVKRTVPSISGRRHAPSESLLPWRSCRCVWPTACRLLREATRLQCLRGRLLLRRRHWAPVLLLGCAREVRFPFVLFFLGSRSVLRGSPIYRLAQEAFLEEGTPPPALRVLFGMFILPLLLP